MRVFAAILTLMLGSSVALAQGDAKQSYGPVTASHAAPAKAKPGRKAKTERKDTPAAAAETTKPATAPAKPAVAKSASGKSAPIKTTTTGSANAGTPDIKPSALRDAYASIPFAERMAIQSGLTWGGDYTGPVDGEFSDRLVEAVKAYQKRHKNPATGILSPQERSALASAIESRQREVGWRVVDDPVIGARVGIPGKFATKTTPGQNGTLWSSEQGQLQIETFRIDTGATLEAIFEQQKRLPRRQIGSSALETDAFVIAGMQGLKKMVVRGYARNGEVRGITILYDQAMEGTMDPLVAPMTGAFAPFARFSVASIAETPRRKVEYGTGLFVSSVGHVLTDRQLVAGCNIIALPGLGRAERVATDSSGQLALLRAYSARNVAPIGLLDTPSNDGDVTLVGIADPQAQGGADAVTAVTAHLGAAAGTRALDSPPALGFAGAAALDAQGRFAGMVTLKPALVAGPAGAPQAMMVPVESIRNFLEAHFVAPASGKPGVEGAKASVVRVICVRE